MPVAPDSVARWENELKPLQRPNRESVSAAMCPRAWKSERTRARKIRVYLAQGQYGTLARKRIRLAR